MSGARLRPNEEFRGPGLEEVGLRSYAHLMSGRRVLIRRRVGERIELTLAGRRFFERFREHRVEQGVLQTLFQDPEISRILETP